MKKIFVYCAGGMGREMADLAEEIYGTKELFFVDDFAEKNEIDGVPVIKSSDLYRKITQGDEVIIANGEPLYRKNLLSQLKELGYEKLGTIIANSSEVSKGAKIEDATIIHRKSIISTGSYIKKGSYINKGVIIGHDVSIGECSVIGPGVIIGGYSQIGNGVYIGSGAVIRDRISIGDNCIIGMGSNVVSDVESNKVVVGNPAKVIRDNITGLVF